MYHFMGLADDSAHFKWIDSFLTLRLGRLEPVLAAREWLAGGFSGADIAMADVLRVVDNSAAWRGTRRAGPMWRARRRGRHSRRPTRTRWGILRWGIEGGVCAPSLSIYVSSGRRRDSNPQSFRPTRVSG